jgi:cell division protein FtsW
MHPAELAKLALIVYLAHWLARRGQTAGTLFGGLVPFLLIAGPVIGLVAVEPDLGTTGVVLVTSVVMFFVAGGSVLQLLALVPGGLIALALYVTSNEYQLRRWQTFLDPWAVCLTDGFHTCQGLMALALGGVFGNGLGISRQPGGLYLPNADNDFVFAMVGQESGLVGGSLVVGLFVFFAWRGLRVALGAPDTFGALLAVGVTGWIASQALINIGVVVNLLPVTGITLPFVSSGGTSLVVSFAAVGILLSISRETQARAAARSTGPPGDGPATSRAPAGSPKAATRREPAPVKTAERREPTSVKTAERREPTVRRHASRER